MEKFAVQALALLLVLLENADTAELGVNEHRFIAGFAATHDLPDFVAADVLALATNGDKWVKHVVPEDATLAHRYMRGPDYDEALATLKKEAAPWYEQAHAIDAAMLALASTLKGQVKAEVPDAFTRAMPNI